MVSKMAPTQRLLQPHKRPERVIRPVSGVEPWPGQSKCSLQTQRDQAAAKVAKRMGNVQSNYWLREWLSTSEPVRDARE